MKKYIPQDISLVLVNIFARLNRYKFLVFVLSLALVYGYILFTISSLSNAKPAESLISEQSKPINSAKIDKKVVRQLEQLQDNSVTVQALFNEARDNPFQEQ